MVRSYISLDRIVRGTYIVLFTLVSPGFEKCLERELNKIAAYVALTYDKEEQIQEQEQEHRTTRKRARAVGRGSGRRNGKYFDDCIAWVNRIHRHC
jgi:hypothetical protein